MVCVLIVLLVKILSIIFDLPFIDLPLSLFLVLVPVLIIPSPVIGLPLDPQFREITLVIIVPIALLAALAPVVLVLFNLQG